MNVAQRVCGISHGGSPGLSCASAAPATIVRSLGDIVFPDVTAVTGCGIASSINDLEFVTGFIDPVTNAMAAVTIGNFLEFPVFFAPVTFVTGVTAPFSYARKTSSARSAALIYCSSVMIFIVTT
jgi:hypothetical protein